MIGRRRLGAGMKILVVDDHELIRDALRGVLGELDQAAVILEAADGVTAMRLVEEHGDLGLLLLDLTLPDREGFALLAELRGSHPALAIVVLSALQDRANVMQALDLGALGFIPKSAPREIMLNALRLVVSGGVYIPPQILAREEPKPSPPPKARAPCSPADLGLTGRQLAVLGLMMRGKSNKAIARALDLAEPTVKNHVTAILKALKSSNRTEAVIAVGELGWDLTAADKG
jgi:DNA-binding NarL/FixJ family response regulator